MHDGKGQLGRIPVAIIHIIISAFHSFAFFAIYKKVAREQGVLGMNNPSGTLHRLCFCELITREQGERQGAPASSPAPV